MLTELLAPETLRRVDGMLSNDTPLIGPASLIVTHPHLWSNNAARARQVLGKLRIDLPAGTPPFFFAGTAFWLDHWLVDRLAELRDLPLRSGDDSYDADGSFGHAFERIIALIPLMSGRGVGDTLGQVYRRGEHPVGLVPAPLAQAFKVPSFDSKGRHSMKVAKIAAALRNAIGPMSRGIARLADVVAFLLLHRRTVKELGLFDPTYYSASVRSRAVRVAPLFHYLMVGHGRRIPPSASVDPVLLADQYRPFALQRLSPLEIYVRYGRQYGHEFRDPHEIEEPPPVSWPSEPTCRTALVVHAFHFEETELIFEALASCRIRCDLIVTTPHEPAEIERIAAAGNAAVPNLSMPESRA